MRIQSKMNNLKLPPPKKTKKKDSKQGANTTKSRGKRKRK